MPPEIEWVGGPPQRLERLVASGPLLVHFLDFAQLNCARTLPYLRAWHERYGGIGLGVIGVHSPRFPFTRDAGAVADALPRLGIGWPVAVDSEHRVWRDYGCRGWPSLFLWNRGGTLAWHHLGEGEYVGTEEAIREALGDSPNGDWPDPVPPVRPTDAPGATVIAPTPEVFPGGSPETPWSQGASGEPLRIPYEAGGAHAAVDGSGELQRSLDGGETERVPVEAPGLVELAAHDGHQRHLLELGASPGLRVYSVQFPPAAA
jgi:hypothetical protein